MTNVSAGVGPLTQDGGVTHFATGVYTGDGTAGTIAVAIGFTPKYVRLINVTDGIMFEYHEGLDTSSYNTTLKTVFSTGVVTEDTNSVITTNATLKTSTEVAFPAPGAQSADDGVSGTVTVSNMVTDKTKNPLNFVAGSSGALANINAKAYVWMAIGG